MLTSRWLVVTSLHRSHQSWRVNVGTGHLGLQAGCVSFWKWRRESRWWVGRAAAGALIVRTPQTVTYSLAVESNVQDGTYIYL